MRRPNAHNRTLKTSTCHCHYWTVAERFSNENHMSPFYPSSTRGYQADSSRDSQLARFTGSLYSQALVGGLELLLARTSSCDFIHPCQGRTSKQPRHGAGDAEPGNRELGSARGCSHIRAGVVCLGVVYRFVQVRRSLDGLSWGCLQWKRNSAYYKRGSLQVKKYYSRNATDENPLELPMRSLIFDHSVHKVGNLVDCPSQEPSSLHIPFYRPWNYVAARKRPMELYRSR
ncbi:hypothetical protein RRG08_055704 [Elysia crispata]|uniref:Uncharacterized protein n=1 Tax=Elysia crispata TaxID=231223 RepID=A0AAE1B085_9GAST|nr:hypothetical protein RRG08_055704 [Elysia crispata]